MLIASPVAATAAAPFNAPFLLLGFNVLSKPFTGALL